MARELAERRSTSVTNAVRQALRAELERCPNSGRHEAIAARKAALFDAAARAHVVRLSAASRLELALVAESARHGINATEVEQLLLALRVEVMPFDQHQLHLALES